MWKITFFGLISGQDLKNRAAHPDQELLGVPPRAQTQEETRLKLQVKTFILVSKNTKNKRAQRHLPVTEFA